MSNENRPTDNSSARVLLEELVRQSPPADEVFDVHTMKVRDGRDLPEVQRILKAPLDVQREFLLHALEGHALGVPDDYWLWMRLRRLISAILRRDLGWSQGELVRLVNATLSNPANAVGASVAHGGVLRAVEQYCSKAAITPAPGDPLHCALQRARLVLSAYARYATERKSVERIDAILGMSGPQPPLPIVDGDAWTAAALLDLDAMKPKQRASWLALLKHCASATASRPTQKWLAEAKRLISDLGEDDYAHYCSAWLLHIGKPGTIAAAYREPAMQPSSDPTVLNQANADVLRGLIWCGVHVPTHAVLDAIVHAADAAFQKLVNIGPRCPKVGNACLQTLSTVNDETAIAALVRLRTRSRHRSIQKQLDSALNRAAAQRGETPEDLVELVTPTFGLDERGMLQRTVGEAYVELQIVGSVTVGASWQRGGRVLRSPPKQVREQHEAEVKAVAKLKRDIESALRAQRHRLERLLAVDRHWTYSQWRERYVDHPLLARMSRLLIWEFTASDSEDASKPPRAASGMVVNNRIVDSNGKHLAWVGEGVSVALWHPIRRGVDEVRLWREFLISREIVQPFKQAHREVYILTDAERETATFSNRFAAHILRQHQLAALCAERGWSYKLQGMHFDGGAPPTLELPAFGLVATYNTGVLEDAQAHSGAGIGLYVTTDWVSFHRGLDGEPVALEEIPEAVFSEVMRDVDLFVGVCSIGRDPGWPDYAPDAPHLEYIRRFIRDDLPAAGIVRREVLQRVLPRLSIADDCTLEERYLCVRGRLGIYRIHLGSGSVIKEPDGQFLCIVPGAPLHRADRGNVYLPFEGDHMLALILSKAFMLARDDKIKDSSIVSQIKLR